MTISVRHVSANTWELSFRSNARVERAFEYLVAFERHVEWEEQLTDVERLRAADGAAGASFVKTYGARPAGLLRRLFWRPVRVDCTITAVERPELIAWRQELWRDQPSESYYRQDVEVRMTPDGDGCRVTFTRHLMPDDSFSLATVTKAHAFIQSRLGQLPPEAREALEALHRQHRPDEPVRPASADEAAGELLENLPIRGPGSRSLARLKAVLDSQR